jgi:hypothetical protein
MKDEKKRRNQKVAKYEKDLKKEMNGDGEKEKKGNEEE